MQTSTLRNILDKADAFDKIASIISKELETVINCSFCGKHQSKVLKIVAGPSVYICNECVNLCTEIISGELFEVLMDGEGI